MCPFSRLLILEDLGADDDVYFHSALEAYRGTKSFVYLVRSNSVSASASDPVSSSMIPSSRRGTLGQLFIFLYRSLGGKKCFVYSEGDVLTILKMAQMKSGDAQTRDSPTPNYLRGRRRKTLEKLRNAWSDVELDTTDDDCRGFESSSEETTAPDSSSIFEYYESFLDHSKCCDSYEMTDFVADAIRDATPDARSILDNFVVVVDRKTLLSATSSSRFGRAAALLLFGGAASISIVRRGGVGSPSSIADVSRREASSSLLRSRLSNDVKKRKTEASLFESPARPRVSSESPDCGSAASPGGTSIRARSSANGTPRNLRVTPRRTRDTPKNQSPSPSVPSFASPASSTETHAHHVILSYLRLVLNSRDELALARCVDTPKRGLDQEAFTDLRHEAEAKGLPMFQCASSFVIRLRLGGKGYQAGDDSRLRSHAKGLGELVDLIQRCQNVIEEGDKDPVASLQKVVNVLKSSIVKARDNRLRVSSIEKAAKSIRELIPLQLSRMTLIRDFIRKHQTDDKENRKKIGAQGSMTKELLRFLLDEETGANLDAKEETLGVILSDAYSSTATPVRFPSLWSQFQSPSSAIEDGEGVASSFSSASPPLSRRAPRGNGNGTAPLSPLCLDEAVGKKNNKRKNGTPIAMKSSFTWATSDSPPCHAATNPMTKKRPGTSSLFDGDGQKGADDDGDDESFVSTQDAAGPTLVMRTKKRKRDAGDGEIDATESRSLRENSEGGSGRAGEGGSRAGNDEGVSTSASVVAADGERLAKKPKVKTNLSAPTTTTKSLKKTDPNKPKARRKIIPLLSGQQKLSGFFKS